MARLLALPALASTATSACAGTPRITESAVAVFALESVVRPAEVAQRWGAHTIEESGDGFAYSDDLINLVVLPEGGTFSLIAENRTAHSMRLIWDDASYVDPQGFASGVVSGSTRIMDIGRSQPAEVIPAGARVALRAIPISNIDRSGVETRFTGFYPGSASCEDMEGGGMRLLLPLEIEGTVNEYTLVFSVKEAFIEVTTSTPTGHVARRQVEESRFSCPERP